uniref:Uncharacterized protein n=1 Tax=Chromera velia CCMP2878 TaxID=1169474 RepID=A0A0G4I3I1_9ALVE|eukprot:Cvel_10592.t1-p1 / transcript=Cvel_10592.t1 / gene=Cvel_10592 / organism=Chromera_velia_CCMP2878 / gene_product=hypothetical protein / transcript_product=hypothetical protein / location=Cvel_scaffold642:41194-44780(+) / protein_length=501 / sequence_SO=supercontig / SO=protein_coding / is_pseudo=false
MGSLGLDLTGPLAEEHDKRPDLFTTLPNGDSILRDVALIHPIQDATRLHRNAKKAGAAAKEKEGKKHIHYDDACIAVGIRFVPMVFETYGRPGGETVRFVKEMVRQATERLEEMNDVSAPGAVICGRAESPSAGSKFAMEPGDPLPPSMKEPDSSPNPSQSQQTGTGAASGSVAVDVLPSGEISQASASQAATGEHSTGKDGQRNFLEAERRAPLSSSTRTEPTPQETPPTASSPSETSTETDEAPPTPPPETEPESTAEALTAPGSGDNEISSSTHPPADAPTVTSGEAATPIAEGSHVVAVHEGRGDGPPVTSASSPVGGGDGEEAPGASFVERGAQYIIATDSATAPVLRFVSPDSDLSDARFSMGQEALIELSARERSRQKHGLKVEERHRTRSEARAKELERGRERAKMVQMVGMMAANGLATGASGLLTEALPTIDDDYPYKCKCGADGFCVNFVNPESEQQQRPCNPGEGAATRSLGSLPTGLFAFVLFLFAMV